MVKIPEEVRSQIEKIRQQCLKIKPEVVIFSLAYNHGSYIRDTLDGFIMQQTDFPFVAIVHDDASTDNTAKILKEYASKYADIIFPIYETENQYSKDSGVLGKIMNAAIAATGSEFVAMCECDDYWTDKLKLQKQFDFLKSHIDYGMCYSFCLVEEASFINPNKTFGLNRCSFIELLVNGNCIPTPTVFLRTQLYNKFNKYICPDRHKWKMGDYPVWLFIARISKIKCIPDIVGVYRKLEESASHSNNINKKIDFDRSYRDIKLFYNKNYNENNPKCVRIINYKYLKTLIVRYLEDKSLRSKIHSEMVGLELSFIHKLIIWGCTIPIFYKTLIFILKRD